MHTIDPSRSIETRHIAVTVPQPQRQPLLQFLGGTLAMIAFPQVLQRRAQNELDTVVGRDRPPAFATLLVFHKHAQSSKKFLRWRPVVPNWDASEYLTR